MPTIGVLGVLEVRDQAGRPVGIRRRKQRALLALLATNLDRPLTADQIIERLWQVRPASARANVHSYISGLRHLFAATGAPVRLAMTSQGYRLELPAERCDATLFRELAQAARQAAARGRPAEAADLLARALGLWRGEVLEDLEPYDWIEPYAAQLDDARITAIEDRVDARLALGEHADLAVELADLVAAHPLRERLSGQHMVALHRAGRDDEAVAAYDRLRATLAAELDVPPSPATQKLYRQIRAAAGQIPPRHRQPGRTAGVVPALLPPNVADFTGRTTVVRALREMLSPTGATAVASGLRIAGITGMAGVGKSALAVQIGHMAAADYPDGQLHVNLRGAGDSPADPGDVLGRFLRSLGVDSRAVPDTLAERTEMYRTVLAKRRVLVLLDNAADAPQVRPLLPGAASCAVVVTSRIRLTAIEGARWIELESLARDEAVQLLARVVADGRVRRQPAAAAAIVRLCGGLPLAIRIAGARLAARPGWRLSHLATLLDDERHGLDQLSTGDLAVSASLALSYEGLEPSARRLLRRLALPELPDFPAWLADAVHGGTAAEAATDLDTLVDAHLLAVAGTGADGQLRYRFHDLVRAYARARAGVEDDEETRSAVLREGLGALLAIAERMAGDVPGPCYARISGAARRPVIDWTRHQVAQIPPLDWFDAERQTMLCAVHQACDAGLDELAFDIAGCLEKYFDMRGMYADWEQLNRRVLEVCRRVGNLRGEAVMLRGLIDVTTWSTSDHSGEAMTRSLAEATRLLDMFTALGDLQGMSDAAVMRAWALTAGGRQQAAADAATEALRLAEESGHLGGRARAYVALAVVLGEDQRVGEGMDCLHRALSAARELGNPRYESTVLQFLGIAHREIGNLDDSERLLTESMSLSHRYRDNYTGVLSMLALARVYMRRRDTRARDIAEQALAIAREYRMSHHVADALGVLGELDLAAGDIADAVAHLTESVTMWRTRGWLSYQAAALATLGSALAGSDPTAARKVLTESREIFARLGKHNRVKEVERLQEAAGLPSSAT
ncbi:AfsR/SARP family transcriptional regulator [Mangrovihabitans endophyticus]|uniref:SARP family transcriptional regulator n=1 Tax=Mangrovihabitans endophyticus TaxID=1751298 RepID=A0A8J3BSL7_9ACTN|nr:BTAD domain-containing putative transcriptional regulator [Mangrovihabitans endophyticus]GGK73885.1 SARP family transcriptional regulator [Mangrovihabitans endophyticus]